MNSRLLKVTGLNLFIISGILVGLFYGIVQPIFVNDASYISFILSFMMLSIVTLVTYDSFRPTQWIMDFVKFEERNLYRIALIGTLIGLVYLISIIGDAVGTMDTPDLAIILKSFAHGLRTSFCPTLVGVFCWVWSSHLVYFSKT